jgi:hypothetical protein
MNNVMIGAVKSKITKLKYSESTGTVRSVPENYWVASVKNGKLVFDSWDGAVKGRINKTYVKKWWEQNKP